ncbi:unnamed protein product [Coregonus sp. 'balchen']|nr:unnamed protein product [Coregonus sp. 'balchen']
MSPFTYSVPGPGPFPGVLDLPVMLNGVSEDLPKQVTYFDHLEYFEEAVEFLSGRPEDDKNWNSCLFAQRAAARLRHHGKDNFEVVTYPRAGHFLEVPYMPHCPSGFHSALGKVVVFGGEAKAHHEAQLDLWRRVQEFFRKHLKDSSNTVQKSML